MDTHQHWETIYATKGPTDVSWYTPHLLQSLTMIERTGVGPTARIIDMGGGASTLVDDLLARGFQHLTVLDISESALRVSRERLGEEASRVTWLQGDVTALPLCSTPAYDIWHDRAVFHFLTQAGARTSYMDRLRH